MGCPRDVVESPRDPMGWEGKKKERTEKTILAPLALRISFRRDDLVHLFPFGVSMKPSEDLITPLWDLIWTSCRSLPESNLPYH